MELGYLFDYITIQGNVKVQFYDYDKGGNVTLIDSANCINNNIEGAVSELGLFGRRVTYVYAKENYLILEIEEITLDDVEFDYGSVTNVKNVDLPYGLKLVFADYYAILMRNEYLIARVDTNYSEPFEKHTIKEVAKLVCNFAMYSGEEENDYIDESELRERLNEGELDE